MRPGCCTHCCTSANSRCSDGVRRSDDGLKTAWDLLLSALQRSKLCGSSSIRAHARNTCLAAKGYRFRRLRQSLLTSHTEHGFSAQSATGRRFFLGLVVSLVVNSSISSAYGLRLIGMYAVKRNKWICRRKSLQAATWVRAKAADHQGGGRRKRPDVAARLGRKLPAAEGRSPSRLSDRSTDCCSKPTAASVRSTDGPGSNSGGGLPHTRQTAR